MTQNPFLHVFVARVTTTWYAVFAADYTLDHLGLDPTLRGHLSGAYLRSRPI